MNASGRDSTPTRFTKSVSAAFWIETLAQPSSTSAAPAHAMSVLSRLETPSLCKSHAILDSRSVSGFDSFHSLV